MFQLLLAVIYLAFISLGLPDSLLGSAWPTIYQEMEVPVSYAGAVFMIISMGTIVSSLQSDRLTRRFGTGKVTAVSVLTTAVALLGFSISNSYWMLLLWAIPYGLGAGSVDASLNNYVALHYESRHMSWLHCMWGVGASVGPYIMSFALTNGQGWHMGYRYVAYLQIGLTMLLLLSLPLWKKQGSPNKENQHAEARKTGIENPGTGNPRTGNTGTDNSGTENTRTERALRLKDIVRIPGVKQVMLMFFCYCALEQTAGLWASSYLVLKYGIDLETAAGYGSLFFVGITVGRAVSGFLTLKWNDNQMIRFGQCIVFAGIALMVFPFGQQVALIGLIVIGLGCAPIYPCVIHSTPDNFGAERSQAIVGVQMASAYTGNLLMPPLFGIIARNISAGLFPVYMLMILAIMFVMHGQLQRVVRREESVIRRNCIQKAENL